MRIRNPKGTGSTSVGLRPNILCGIPTTSNSGEGEGTCGMWKLGRRTTTFKCTSRAQIRPKVTMCLVCLGWSRYLRVAGWSGLNPAEVAETNGHSHLAKKLR